MCCSEELILERVVNDSLFSAAFDPECNGHGVMWNTIEKVGGAIKGVYNPLILIAFL